MRSWTSANGGALTRLSGEPAFHNAAPSQSQSVPSGPKASWRGSPIHSSWGWNTAS